MLLYARFKPSFQAHEFAREGIKLSRLQLTPFLPVTRSEMLATGDIAVANGLVAQCCLHLIGVPIISHCPFID